MTKEQAMAICDNTELTLFTLFSSLPSEGGKLVKGPGERLGFAIVEAMRCFERAKLDITHDKTHESAGE
jgi:hypothetical protein